MTDRRWRLALPAVGDGRPGGHQGQRQVAGPAAAVHVARVVLRVGFLVGAPSLLSRLARERMFVDRQGVSVIEAAVAELLEDGEVARHVRRVRREYHQRRDVLVSALRRYLGAALSFQVPAGGLALWAQAASGIDIARWQRRALQAGVHFQIAREFTFDGSAPPFLRLGFAHCNQPELQTAVRRLARCLG